MIEKDVAWTAFHLRSIGSEGGPDAFHKVLQNILSNIDCYTYIKEIISLYKALGCLLKYTKEQANQEYFSAFVFKVEGTTEDITQYLLKLLLCKLNQHYEGKEKNEVEMDEIDDLKKNSEDLLNEKMMNNCLTELLEEVVLEKVVLETSGTEPFEED